MEKQIKKCVIVSGGDISDYEYLKKYFDNETIIISVDGGYSHCEKMKIIPDIIIGDFDSIKTKKSELKYKIEILELVPEKDDTDTLSAVKYAIEKKVAKIYIFGVFGGRLDHEIANLSLLKYAKNHNVECVLIDKKNMAFLVENSTIEIEKNDNYYLSVFAIFSQNTIVTLKGVKYPLDKYLLNDYFPIGVSNEIIENKAQIIAQNGNLLVVLSEKN